jgi:peptidoglycan/xylan/chitin deacetylase (PgdA/CDA1 family)
LILAPYVMLQTQTETVVLYHSFRRSSSGPVLPCLHDVDEITARKQFLLLRRKFPQGVGKFALSVSIDDGYRSVFEIGIPLLIEAGIPVTVNLTGSMLAGEGLWRDFVRVLIKNRLTAEFSARWRERSGQNLPDDPERFYRATKNPELYSTALQDEIRNFTRLRCPEDFAVCIDLCATPKHVVFHPLVTYGNHGYAHHVMSALDGGEQRNDIERNAALMNQWIPLEKQSPIFALPFGGGRDATRDTIDVLKDLGYGGIAYSRGRINLGKPKPGFCRVERWMAPTELGKFTRDLGRLKRKTYYRIAKDLVRGLSGRKTT